ncbi:Z1 domain-containing protein [Alcaligenaceae bacterium B3P038]|nr:Z1 domain-containing protein [Alcaligenaceae bacterium B3P038]
MPVKKLSSMSENAKRLEIGVITTLTVSGIPTESDINGLASALRLIPVYNVTDEEFDQVIKNLHHALTIDMGLGSRVTGEHTPWLQARKPEIDPFYWSRYQTELRKQGLPPRVVGSLDRVTDELLDLMGNPVDESGWPRRGLVMGDVQSGKTSTYTGLICKAADAGYRLVILLTGVLESLRKQTQERLDSGFVGLDSSGVVNRRHQKREIGVGLVNGARSAGVFTSTMDDFKATTVNQLGFKLRDYKEPVLLVVKKNKKILENLTDWLVTFNASHGGKIGLPMLLIDDEADNASVNTSQKTVTAINAGIRNLLNVFPSSSYVGFTATPFANVFINPDTTDEMVGDDLFPRDFIYALDAPSNYVGARAIFADESALDCLREIDDVSPEFASLKRSDSIVIDVPESMIEAMRCFIVANALMDLRAGTPAHRSMLINVSHFTGVQNQIRDIVHVLLSQIQSDIRNYSSLSAAEAVKNKNLFDLQATFHREFGHLDVTWGTVQKALNAAALPIEVRSVNSSSGPSSLDYKLYSEHGLRVIAVGGNSLARGLTLEGLCVSYFYRRTQMYDALLQMGRWFGYRTAYEDLFRVWMTPASANWYAYISSATDELRAEIRRMQMARLKPIDFGLRVRASPDALLITAKNKMRNSEEISHTLNISEESIESPRVLLDRKVIQDNFLVAKKLLDSLVALSPPPEGAPLTWQLVDKIYVVEFLRHYVSHPLNVKLQTRDLADFIESSMDSSLRSWDVAFPGGGGSRVTGIEIPIKSRERNITVDSSNRSIFINGKKMRVGSPSDERAGMTEPQIKAAEAFFRESEENSGAKTVPSSAYRAFRSRPLLIVHFVTPTGAQPESAEIAPGNLVAIGLSFPKLGQDTQRVKYRINLVELRNLMAAELSEVESDDELTDE